jgi:flagellar basal body-associated protein FliL
MVETETHGLGKSSILTLIIIGMQFVVMVAGAIAWWTSHESSSASSALLQARILEDTTKRIDVTVKRIDTIEERQHDNIEKYAPQIARMEVQLESNTRLTQENNQLLKAILEKHQP